jgi:transcriptional regulator with XRE-family HTH domain
MPTAPDNHDAHDYAERIRERLPRRLQEQRERCGMSKYRLAGESGVSREYIGKIERGKAYPTLPVTAQISHGLGMTLEQFTGVLASSDALRIAVHAVFAHVTAALIEGFHFQSRTSGMSWPFWSM